jgi:hypothetical protein
MGHISLVYADYDNLLAKNINIIKKNIEALLDASKKAGLEVCSCLVTRLQDKIII